MRRAVGVVRVSKTRGREGESFHSPKTQLERIRQACEREGVELVEHVQELDVSGTAPLEKRPGLSRAIAAVEGGRADVIVVAYFDRLVRSVRVQAEVAERVEAAGGNVWALDTGMISDGGAAAKLQANMLGAVAQYVADQTRDKVGEAQARAVSLGIPPWPRTPPGYKRGPDKRYLLDAELSPIVEGLFLRRAAGAGISELRDWLEARGIQRTPGGVAAMLRKRVYLGEIHFGDLVNESAHPPIVSRRLFDEVQSVRVPRRHPNKPSDRLLARLGVVRCANCRSRMVVGNDGKSGDYYCCPPHGARGSQCDRRSTVSAPLVEGLVVQRVQLELRDRVGRASAESDAARTLAELDAADLELSRLLRLLTAAGAQDELEAVEQLRRARDARNVARAAHAEAMARTDAWTVTADDWDVLTRDEQRALIRAVVDTVWIRKGRGPGRVTIDVRGPEP